MRHLTLSSWTALRSGALATSELAELRAHLAEPCEICESVLAEAGAADELDAPVDAALARLAPQPSPRDAERMQALERRVLRSLRRQPEPRGWLSRLFGPSLGFAAGCAATLLAVWVRPAGYVGLKGQAEGPRPPGFTALVAERNPDGSLLLSRADGRRAYSAQAELYPTYDLSAPAHVYAVRLGEDGSAELFYPPPGAPQPEAAGIHPLAVGGVVYSYSLDGLAGRQRFVLLTSSRGPLSPDRAIALARSSPQEGPVQSAVIEVRVDPKAAR